MFPADPGGSRREGGGRDARRHPQHARGAGPDALSRAGPMMRVARAARTRWRAMFLVTGAVLTILVSCWPAARFSFLASSRWSPCCME